jgi:hypothetical protein
MKVPRFSWTLPALFGVAALLASAGLEAKKPPDKVVVKACVKKKSPVTFSHVGHVKKLKIKCATCHHKKDAKQFSCSSAKCHAGKAKDKVPGCAEMSKKKNPYHLQCIGCHKKKKKGPAKCKGCHK